MKKILICAVIVLLCILAFFTIFRGISIGNFKILSIKQIGEANDNLSLEISQTELLMHSTYQTKATELEGNITRLLNAKREYLDLAQVSTVGEIKGATQTEEYTSEFLMAKLGNYSGLYGVNLTYTPTTITQSDPSLKNISFTVVGNYIPIKDFIEAIESDTELGFRIYAFKMEPNGTDTVRASFTVRNVRMKQEIVSYTDNSVNNTENVVNNGNTSATPSSSAQETEERKVENTTYSENVLNTESTGNTQNTQNVENSENT